MCWGATQVHPIETEDHAIGLVKYENGAIGQFEVSWSFRGGMDLRDEIVGTEGTIWLNHWLRTGFEMFTANTANTANDYVSEKSESSRGWLFPVGNEVSALGYSDMFDEMLTCFEQQKQPRETFYDGYVVNSIIDAAYRSMQTKKWEPIELQDWRGDGEKIKDKGIEWYDNENVIIKRELMPDGTRKFILRNQTTGEVTQRIGSQLDL
jgi:predicted dehydrogenase